MTRGGFKRGTNPGNSGTEKIADTSLFNSGPARSIGRHQLFVYVTAQAVTVKYSAKVHGGTWRVINGAGSGDTVASGDSADFNWMAVGEEQKVEIVCGVTAPTVYDVVYNPVSGEMAEP